MLKSPREIAIMREAGKVVAAVITALEEKTEAGMTTRDLDQIAATMFKEVGAESTALGYFGYPGHICVSVNDEVVHGIPGSRKLKRGDLVKCDVAARYRGYSRLDALFWCWGRGYAGAAHARTGGHPGGAVSRDQQAVAGRLSDIGAAIEEHVTKHGMSVVRDFVGHGVGRQMHEAPQVHHHGPPGRGPVLRPGMCLAIEPQVNLGSPSVRMLDDGWTAVTVDGSLSCHFEHTVAAHDALDRPQVPLTLPATRETPEAGSVGVCPPAR